MTLPMIAYTILLISWKSLVLHLILLCNVSLLVTHMVRSTYGKTLCSLFEFMFCDVTDCASCCAMSQIVLHVRCHRLCFMLCDVIVFQLLQLQWLLYMCTYLIIPHHPHIGTVGSSNNVQYMIIIVYHDNL